MAVQSGQKRELWTHLRSPRVLFVFGNSYRIEKSFDNHLPRGNTQVTINPKQPSKTARISQDHSKKKQKWCLETSSKNYSNQTKIFMDPNSSSNHRWKKKPALSTGPRHLELLNLSQFLLQGPHPPTQGLRITWIHRWPAPQRAGLAQGQVMPPTKHQTKRLVLEEKCFSPDNWEMS